MTSHTPFSHQDDAFDQWLNEHQRALIEDLDNVLDVEAGLREVLLQSRRAAIVDDLNTILDVESGLAAILPTQSSSSSTLQPKPHVSEQDRAAAANEKEVLRLVSPEERLTLRRTPDVSAAYLNLETVYSFIDLLNIARSNTLSLTSSLNQAQDYVDIQDYVRELTQTIDLALEFAHDVDSINRARDVAYALVQAHELIQTIDRDLVPSFPVGILLDRSTTLHLVLDHIDDRAFLDLGVDEIRRAITAVVGRDLPRLTEESVKVFLNDFTEADLRTANLIGVDLTDVRWSEDGTLWPEAMDIEDLKARSEETSEGSGIYVVLGGSATMRDFVDLA